MPTSASVHSHFASACVHRRVGGCMLAFPCERHTRIPTRAPAGASGCLHLHVHQHAYIGVFAIAYMHSHSNWQAGIVIRASVCMHKRVHISVPASVCALACAFACEHRHAHARWCINMHASACVHFLCAHSHARQRACFGMLTSTYASVCLPHHARFGVCAFAYLHWRAH